MESPGHGVRALSKVEIRLLDHYDAGFFIKRRNNASGQVTHVTGVMHWCSPGRALCLREPRGRRGVGAPRGGRAAPARPSGLTALV
ncbi:uncharacterized protein [Macaca nemestrina]|uniref:uncharacterized protein isoform X2 n=1 Tax=Macaca nemestrina TaxID=9545 RepID=UPI0039B9420E